MKNTDRRVKRHYKIRKTLAGTKECPRLSVFRSNVHIYAQIIDDSISKTLIADSDMKIDVKIKKADRAFEVGKRLAVAAIKKGIKKVVFDRGGFLYHGRIARLAEGAREGGLIF